MMKKHIKGDVKEAKSLIKKDKVMMKDVGMKMPKVAVKKAMKKKK